MPARPCPVSAGSSLATRNALGTHPGYFPTPPPLAFSEGCGVPWVSSRFVLAEPGPCCLRPRDVGDWCLTFCSCLPRGPLMLFG